MKRGAISLFVMALFVTACTSMDSTPTTTQPPGVPIPTTTPRGPASPTASAEVDVCGSEFPLFVAGLEENDPKDIDGTPGPGPGSQPVAPGQLVSHWLGEFGAYEMRWPPTGPLAESFAWTQTVAGRPASILGAGSKRIALYVQLDVAGERCSILSAEMYGPRADPLRDFIYLFADALRDRSAAADYLFDLASEVTLSTEGPERPEGRCQSRIVVGSEISPADAVALVGYFLADRSDGSRAQRCLTESGLRSFEEADQSVWPFLCLFECRDGAVFAATKVPPREAGQGTGSQFVEAVISFDDGDTVRSVRETYEVVLVTLPLGETVAAIKLVLADLETQIDEGSAMAFVSDLLRRLAEGHYQTAGELLIGEGVTLEISERLPGIWSVDTSTLLKEFCASAMCTAQSRIVGTSSASYYERDVIVAFEGANGTATKRIGAGAFEGYMTVGGLPPDGQTGTVAVPLVESIFRGRPHSGIVALGERSLEIWGTEASNDPTMFRTATRVENLVVAGGWIVARTWEGDVIATPTTPREDDGYIRIEPGRSIEGAPGTIMGGGVVDGTAYAFFVDAGELLAVDLDSNASQVVISRVDDDSEVVGVSMTGGTVAVTRQDGDTFSYELYDVRRQANLHLELSGRRDVTDADTRGSLVLAPDGSTAAYVAAGSVGLSSAVVVIDVAGKQVGSWQGPEDWNISRLTFDGRWILATLESPSVARLSRSDRILVIDTLTNEQWIVNTFARFAFIN